jgi:microcystin degradation protein MlrC
VTLAKESIAKKQTPVVLADHSDRSGAATWLLKEVIDQKLSNTLIGTVADKDAIEALRKKGVRPGDKFDMMVGGRVDESAGEPVRVVGTVNTVSGGMSRFGGGGGAQLWVSVKFGDGNELVISPYLHQNTDPAAFSEIGINAADFKVIAIKSRVHFRRGYYDSGWARNILLVEPDQPFVGTVRLEALDYKHLKLENFYPFGKNVKYP